MINQSIKHTEEHRQRVSISGTINNVADFNLEPIKPAPRCSQVVGWRYLVYCRLQLLIVLLAKWLLLLQYMNSCCVASSCICITIRVYGSIYNRSDLLIGLLISSMKGVTCTESSFVLFCVCARAFFSPDRQRNALSMPLSHHGLTTVTRSYTVRLQLTSPVYSEYKTRLPGWLRVARVATVPHPCYANSTGCPLCAEFISSYLYSLTKPCTTTRQCIYVNSCARINRQEHCALRTITC